MIGNWRIGTYNAVLVAAYLIPAWLFAAWGIVDNPVRGFYARPNIAFSLFVSDDLHLAALGTARAAWTLAVLKLTVVGFFVMFLCQTVRPASRLRGEGDEALVIALCLGGAISLAGMMLAAHAGEHEALRLHATETLLLITAGILVLLGPMMGGGSTVAQSPSPGARGLAPKRLHRIPL